MKQKTSTPNIASGVDIIFIFLNYKKTIEGYSFEVEVDTPNWIIDFNPKENEVLKSVMALSSSHKIYNISSGI